MSNYFDSFLPSFLPSVLFCSVRFTVYFMDLGSVTGVVRLLVAFCSLRKSFIYSQNVDDILSRDVLEEIPTLM